MSTIGCRQIADSMESCSVRTARFALSRRDTSRIVLALMLGLCFLCPCRNARAEDARLQAVGHPNSEQEAFFETKVRPLLAARCFRCHGEKEQKGGIRLDSGEALLGHNEDEALVRPGKPEVSRVIEVIGYKDEPKMPPDGKLPDADANPPRMDSTRSSLSFEANRLDRRASQ